MLTFSWGILRKKILETSLHKPLSWYRFIDDVDMKWTESDEELNSFITHANSIHPTIKFTHESSKTKISFLDTTTTFENGIISTDIHTKPTDKHQYLSPQSCHPTHCTKSIPYSQALRVKRICSSENTTKQRLGILRSNLKKRGYKNKVIKKGFERANQHQREELLQYKKKKVNNRVPFVLTFHPAFKNLSSIMREHWQSLQKHQTLSKIFPEPPVLAFRRPKSIKDRLVRADIKVKRDSPRQSQSCGDKRCKTCDQMQCTETFTSKSTREVHKLACTTNCKTKNTVYLLECGICGFQYVGESVLQFNRRFNLHRSDLEHKQTLPLSRHLRSSNHRPEDFYRLKVTIIDHKPTWSDRERKNREHFWIRKLNTISPFGINEKL